MTDKYHTDMKQNPKLKFLLLAFSVIFLEKVSEAMKSVGARGLRLKE